MYPPLAICICICICICIYIICNCCCVIWTAVGLARPAPAAGGIDMFAPVCGTRKAGFASGAACCVFFEPVVFPQQLQNHVTRHSSQQPPKFVVSLTDALVATCGSNERTLRAGWWWCSVLSSCTVPTGTAKERCQAFWAAGTRACGLLSVHQTVATLGSKGQACGAIGTIACHCGGHLMSKWRWAWWLVHVQKSRLDV